MRRLLAVLSVVAAAACAHTAPPAQPVSTPITAATPTAAATTAIAIASPSPAPKPLASVAPCPLALSASYLIYSPIPPRPGDPPRRGQSVPLSVGVDVEREGRVLATKDFQGNACIDVPPGPVTVKVTRCDGCTCMQPPAVVTVPASVGLDCMGPQPPRAPPPHP